MRGLIVQGLVFSASHPPLFAAISLDVSLKIIEPLDIVACYFHALGSDVCEVGRKLSVYLSDARAVYIVFFLFMITRGKIQSTSLGYVKGIERRLDHALLFF